MKDSSRGLIGNSLLQALTRRDFARLEPLLEEVPLVSHQMLSVAAEKIAFAYFPLRGMVSLVRHMADGSYAEVGLVGREGFVGVSLLHGVTRSPIEAMVQGEGAALRIRTKDLLAAVGRKPDLKAQLLAYAELAYIQATQTAACNVRHTLHQRLLRWLLEADDRLQQDDMVLGQDFLAMMLGVRRAGVSVGLRDVSAAGLIKTGIRSIRILDRPGMEAAACECYAATRTESERLLPAA